MYLSTQNEEERQMIKQMKEGLKMIKEDAQSAGFKFKVLSQKECSASVKVSDGQVYNGTKYLLMGRGWKLEGDTWHFN